MRTLNQAGKLDDLIAQLRSQASSGAGASAILTLENLFDLELASNRRGDAVRTAERIVAIKPRDLVRRIALGSKLAQAGLREESAAHYRKALADEPSLAATAFFQMYLVSEGAVGPAELGRLVAKLPMRLTGEPQFFTQFLDRLGGSPETAPLARELAFKLWETFPTEAVRGLGRMRNLDLSSRPSNIRAALRSTPTQRRSPGSFRLVGPR